VLTRTDELIEALATDLVEHLNLLAAYLNLRNFGYYFGTLYNRSTYGDGTVIVNEENLLEGELVANLGICDVQYADLLIWLNSELLALNLNNCEHLFNKTLIVSPRGEYPNVGFCFIGASTRNQRAKIGIFAIYRLPKR